MRLRVCVAALAAGALLAGCGGSEEPRPLPKTSPSASGSASASVSESPSAPVMPEAAKKKNKRGAIVFARAFIDQVNYAGSTGDTRRLRDLYTSHCTRCESLADGIDKTYRQGGRFEGGAWNATRFDFHAIKGNIAYLDALVDYDEQEWIKQAEAKPRHFPASERNLKVFNLRWAQGGWQVSALDPNQ